MALSTQPYKGARDFYPEQMRVRKYMFKVIRSVTEKYGYEEYDAPILELTDLYLTKGNEEIINEQTYTFLDRGGRSVTLRTEMTPTVTRMVAAKRQELTYPLRWYSIPNCWRYERAQRGRGREFYQLNVDIFGVASMKADLEIIQLADSIMQAFGAKREMYSIRIGSRKLTDYILKEYIGLSEVEAATAIRLIDRKAKMDSAEFIATLDGLMSPSLRESRATDRILEVLSAVNFDQLPVALKTNSIALGVLELVDQLKAGGMTNATYDPTLMRGFDYYTDIVFEFFDNDPENNRSMFGGGRFDGLMDLFGSEPLPAVGFAMGDITLQNFLATHELLPTPKVETELYAVLIGDVYEKARPVIERLRKMGVRAAVDISDRKPDKQLQTAIKKGVRFVMFIGEQELSAEQYTLRDLRKNQEEKLGIERLVTTIKDYRK